MSDRKELLHARALNVELPNGVTVVRDASITIREGEVLTLLGPSGAGKSTLLRALLTRDELLARGYKVTSELNEVHAAPAWVPQRGALLDHLDVADNIALAQIANEQTVDVEPWLKAVGLDLAFAKGRAVGALSGGQVQRVAVARTLAAGRKLLVLDEPSVGLDPLGVRLLAQFLVAQAREQGVGVLLITHDLALAGGASDRILFLDPGTQTLDDVTLDDWNGPLELRGAQERARLLPTLESVVEQKLAAVKTTSAAAGEQRARMKGPSVLRVAGAAIVRALQPRLLGPSLVVLRRTLLQALLRPLLFYAMVGLLLGFTVPYVVAHLTPDLRAATALRLVGGTYIVALAPPLSAIVFVATSGSAINAWLGGLQLNRQVLALEGLGVSQERYLWAPAWCGLALSYLATAVLFAASMMLGGVALFRLYHAPNAWSVLLSDWIDPPPSRVGYVYRASALFFLYATAIASIVVARAVRAKDRTDDVTSAMTSSVVRGTLFVVAMELITVMLLFAWTR